MCKAGGLVADSTTVLRGKNLLAACLDIGVLQVVLAGVTSNLHSGHQPPLSSASGV